MGTSAVGKGGINEANRGRCSFEEQVEPKIALDDHRQRKSITRNYWVLTLVASADSIFGMWEVRKVELSDLFLLFIYVEIIGMIGAFYSTNRIPVTLPMIIAITALCRLIVMQSKSSEPLTLLAEAGAILVLSVAAYVMSLKDKVSLEKLESRHVSEKEDD